MKKNRSPLIRAIAPGWKITPADLKAARNRIQREGFSLSYSPSFSRGDFVFSQTRRFREEDLWSALVQPAVAAVWSVRGGSGAAELLPGLSQRAKSRRPKQDRHFLGLSDVTALHSFLIQKWRWSPLHAPVLARVGGGVASSEELDELFDLLRGDTKQIEFSGLRPLNQYSRNLSGELQGRVFGGNLCVIESLVGTPWAIKARGGFLFLEEVHERGYRILRSLEHLFQARALEGVRAVLWGDIVGGAEPDGSSNTWQAVARFFADRKIPVFRGVQTGHGSVQRVLPLNTPAKLQFTRGGRARLVVQAPRFRVNAKVRS